MFSFGVKLILLILVTAAIVALVGDRIGRSIGRKRLSFFKLRPRHTAALFTILTGMLIALSTVIFLIMVSADVRTALFGLEELKTNLERTKIELNTKIHEKEKIDLQLKQARQELFNTRKGSVLFRVGDLLLTSVIKAGPERAKLETGLNQIISAADTYVKSISTKAGSPWVIVPPAQLHKALSILEERQGENIVRVVATRNTLRSEAVDVKLEVTPNNLIFAEGAEIASTNVVATSSLPEIEQQIKALLYSTHKKAREMGVLPDPSGSVGSVAYADIFSLAKEIKDNGQNVELRTVAKNNIYAIGPLEIEFKVYYQ